MKVFDLHCDTLTYCCDRQLSLHNGETQFGLGRTTEPWYQTFAIFMPDHLRGEAAIAYYEKNLRFFRETLKTEQDLIFQPLTRTDLLKESTKCRAILSVEGGSAIHNEIERVKYLADCGVKMMTLTWNGENEIAGGADTDVGLKPFGVGVIEEMEARHILVDVSHLNDKSFEGVAAAAKKPFIATHSNARAVCNHRRNLTDDQFKEIVRRGGIVGINFYKAFIGTAEEPSVHDLLRHIEHFLALGGENTIALGSDFDGADMPAFLPGSGSIAVLYRAMLEHGLGVYADRIFFENAFRFLQKYAFPM